jgi:hypothetical protein
VDRVHLVEMTQAVLERALRPFAQPLRTLDALHLATLVFLRDSGLEAGLATYDARLAGAASDLGFAQVPC